MVIIIDLHDVLGLEDLDGDSVDLCDDDPALSTTAGEVKHPTTFGHQAGLQWVDLGGWGFKIRMTIWIKLMTTR